MVSVASHIPIFGYPQEPDYQLQEVLYLYYREGIPFHRLNRYRFTVYDGYRFTVDNFVIYWIIHKQVNNWRICYEKVPFHRMSQNSVWHKVWGWS